MQNTVDNNLIIFGVERGQALLLPPLILLLLRFDLENPDILIPPLLGLVLGKRLRIQHLRLQLAQVFAVLLEHCVGVDHLRGHETVFDLLQDIGAHVHLQYKQTLLENIKTNNENNLY